jgi:5'-3' exonuclease
MKPPLLVIDSHFLCYRAFHTAKELTHRGKATGVVFGFLKSISSLKDELQTDQIAFCFEGRESIRKKLFPAYKKKRSEKERTPEETQAFEDMVSQINLLRDDYLPKIGFKNIFAYRGYESDDTMAVLAKTTDKDDEVVLVTSDADLYQMLRPNVSIYSTHKRMLLTESWFVGTYGIRPKQWAVVKAMAGCSSDEIPGIRGVGEKTAIRYLKGELNKDHQIYRTIREPSSRAVVRQNRVLVELPLDGCPVPQIVDDKISRDGWREVCEDLGMSSLAARSPMATRTMMGMGIKL